MGAIAAALARENWVVTGSDEKVYPPMSDYLFDCGIPIFSPYGEGNTPVNSDTIVVGKRVTADNPELSAILKRGVPHLSFPQFLNRCFLSQSRNAVVAGGVGKTTTTAMLAWILEHAGLHPDYLVGGLAHNFEHPARFTGSPFAVLEGDEYASCFDDPQPKFLHYRPEVAIVTNIVEDHPDLYQSLADVCEVFAALAAKLPPQGCLVVPDTDEGALAVAKRAPCQVLTVGLSENASARLQKVHLEPNLTAFELMGVPFALELAGLMNASNAAMAAMAAHHLGVPLNRTAEALREFKGISNRQEGRDIGPCTLVRDKATHPVAIAALAQAVRQRFPQRRVVSLIQPRGTGGRHWVYQQQLPAALSQFDKVIATSSHEHNPQQPPTWADTPFSLDQLAEDLRARDHDPAMFGTLESLKASLPGELLPGDVVVMSVLEQSHALVEAVTAALAEVTTGSPAPGGAAAPTTPAI